MKKILIKFGLTILFIIFLGLAWLYIDTKKNYFHFNCKKVNRCICKDIYIEFLNLCLGNILLSADDITFNTNYNTQQNDPNPYIVDEEVKQSLLNIPPEQLFYYFQNGKIILIKKSDNNGLYFTCSDKSPTKLRIGRQLLVSYWPRIPEEKVLFIFQKERLDYKKESSGTGSYLGDSYLVTTTINSKFQDALQMGNFLVENYDLIKYAEPNFRLETIVDEKTGEPKYSGIDPNCNPSLNAEEIYRLFIPEWDYLYLFDKLTVKEAFNIFYQNTKVPDLVFLDYRSSNMDSLGKASVYSLTGYSPSQQKVYSIIVSLPDEYNQSPSALKEPRITLNTNDASMYVWWELKQPLNYKYWQIDTIKDSPTLVAEAIVKKEPCNGNITFTITPELPNAIIDCNQNNYWNEEIRLSQ